MIKNFKKSLNDRAGVYSITHLPSNKIYIGQTINFYKRFFAHLNYLKSGLHENKYLQNCFNKHDINEFSMNILEVVTDLSLLNGREQFYLDQYYDHQKKCFNIRIHCESNRGLKHLSSRKTFTLIGPANEIIEYSGIVEFSEKYNIHATNLCKLLRGKIKSCEGWRLLENSTYSHNNKNHCRQIGLKNCVFYDKQLVSPNGNIVTGVQNLNKFCIENNLDRAALRRVLKGINNSHKGWKLKQP